MYATYTVLKAVTDFCHFEPVTCSTKFIHFLDICLQSKDSFWTIDADHAGDMNITQQTVTLEKKLNF